MSTGVNTEYCSFTKMVEHLGDRWSLLIMRELMLGGPTGFNTLASAVPGHISRSVLTDRLHRLRDLGLISRTTDEGGRPSYRLAGPGQALMPAFHELRSWANAWLPDDPAMIEREPQIILAWLAERVQVDRLPPRQVVVALTMLHEPDLHTWVVLEDGAEPYGCLEDPLLDESRYVYVEAGMTEFVALARGRRDWREALADGSIDVFGDPELVGQLPRWFRPVAAEPAMAGVAVTAQA
jgi:DNA-binding HxlR family transcriptional regulator